MARKTPNSYGKGHKEKATRLHSLIIRAVGECEHCGRRCECPNAPRSHTVGCPLQCSHVISRRYSHTRTDLENAFCLCASCHSKFGDNPIEHARWAIDRIGEDNYQAMWERAQSTTKFWWDIELDRLTTIAKAMGLK